MISIKSFPLDIKAVPIKKEMGEIGTTLHKSMLELHCEWRRIAQTGHRNSDTLWFPLTKLWSNFQVKVQELRIIAPPCNIPTYHHFLDPNNLKRSSFGSFTFPYKKKDFRPYTLGSGLLTVVFEVIRLQQHKGWCLCSFIYGAQTHSDL